MPGGDPRTNNPTTLGVITLDLDQLVERIADLVLARLNEERESGSPWMDVSGAAAYLGVPVERIRKLIAGRRIPFHQERPGSRISFHRAELDDWQLGL